MKKYWIQDREAGNKIEWFNSEIEAEEQMEKYEAEDKENGIYEPDFYEIEEEVTFTAEELTANFCPIYIISVPHQLPAQKLIFYSEYEIIEYAMEKDPDWDVEDIAEAIESISSDWNSCKVIRNLYDCFWAWKTATHQAGKIRSHIINIINQNTEIYLEDYEEAEKFMAAIETTCKELLNK